MFLLLLISGSRNAFFAAKPNLHISESDGSSSRNRDSIHGRISKRRMNGVWKLYPLVWFCCRLCVGFLVAKHFDVANINVSDEEEAQDFY